MRRAPDALPRRSPPQPIRTIHGTSISGALGFAASLFEGNGYEGLRRVIDVSGDGPNSSGAPVVPTRDAVLEQGFIVNGLPIMLRAPSYTFYSIPDLDIYYADCVIGGPGSFVLPVDDAEPAGGCDPPEAGAGDRRHAAAPDHGGRDPGEHRASTA